MSDMPASSRHDVRITDTTLRDGSHAMAHQFTEEQVRDTVRALDAGGRRGHRGHPRRRPRRQLVQLRLLAAPTRSSSSRPPSRRRTQAPDRGAAGARHRHGRGPPARPRRRARAWSRVATHCTEADVSLQHFGAGPRPGHGDRRLPHDGPPHLARGAGQAGPDHGRRGLPVRRTHRLGGRAAACDDAQARFEALVARGRRRGLGRLPRPPEPVASASPTRCSPHEVGARQIDGSLCALGRGLGQLARPRCWPRCSTGSASTPASTSIGAARRGRGRRPARTCTRWPKMDRNAIVQGWAGVYSSFLLHAERAAERYKVPAHEILAPLRRARATSAARKT